MSKAGKITNSAGNSAGKRGVRGSPRSKDQSASISTSRDFARCMSLLVGDIIAGRVEPNVANAACNAGGKLLRVVELEHRFGRKDASGRLLQLVEVA